MITQAETLVGVTCRSHITMMLIATCKSLSHIDLSLILTALEAEQPFEPQYALCGPHDKHMLA